MRTTDVLVVGAGPSGLALANVLARHGVDHRIVDRKPGPVSQSRAALVHVRTLELLDRLGVAGRALAAGVPLDRVEFRQAARPVATVPLSHRRTGAFMPFPAPLVLEQSETERLLAERLAEFGGRVAWGHALSKLVPGDGSADAVVTGPDGTAETVSARWVVGADGGGSAVRKALGLGFSGRTYDQTGLLADVEIDFPAGTGVGDGVLRLDLTRGGFVGMFHLRSGRWRLFGAVPPEMAPPATSGEVSHDPYAPVSADDLQRWLTEYFVADATLRRVEWSALFRVHSRLAERFQLGNAFLVGDAAHLHSPAGGQGMNLGIGDAVNLGWKLALVATGQARSSLLDSYSAERHPVARTVLRGADRGFALEATSSAAAVWARGHLAGPVMRPLLRVPAVRDAVAGLFAQTWVRYRGSPAVGEQGFGRRVRPGDRAPAVPSETEVMRDLRHDLLIFEGPAPLAGIDGYRERAEKIVARYAVDVAVHVVRSAERALHRAYGASRPCAFLIRPDGHVAHAGSVVDIGTLPTYLDRLYPRRAA